MVVNSQAANAGNYRVLVSNALGSVDSATALLTVDAPPSITIQLSPEIAVCWESLPNRVYQVQFSSDWPAGFWADLGSPVPGNGSSACVVDSAGAQPQRFYRVVRLP